MKTKNFLSRFSTVALVAAAALLPTALTSCSSEADQPNPAPVPEDGKALVTLSLVTPDVLSTRAGNFGDNNTIAADKNEAHINSLWLYIFNVDGSGNTSLYLAEDCTSKITDGDVTDWRDLYSESAALNIAGGSYKFYCVANLDDYLSEADAKKAKPGTTDFNISSEDDLAALTLNFGTNGSKLPAAGTENKGLPMGANATDVTATAKGQNTNLVNASGILTVGSGQVDVKIEMTFLCSAVRYTLLYDAKGVSQFYQSFDIAASNPVKVKNVLGSYTLYSESQAVATATDATVLSGAKKVTLGDNTPAQFIASPCDLEEATDWAKLDKRGYQGIVYLPENFATTTGDDGLKTLISIDYTIAESADQTAESKPANFWLPNPNTGSTADADVLKRGHYYDVMGTVTTSGIEFKVKVNPWKKQDTQKHPI